VVAKLSAKIAIREFEKNRAAKNMLERIPLALVGLACGAFLSYFLAASEGGTTRLLLAAGAGIAFLAASAAAWQAGSSLHTWLAVRRIDAEETASPLDLADEINPENLSLPIEPERTCPSHS